MPKKIRELINRVRTAYHTATTTAKPPDVALNPNCLYYLPIPILKVSQFMHSHPERFIHKYFNTVILALTLLVAGCSFSESSRSISDSVESISDSVESSFDSSGSTSKSSRSSREKRYENEVTDYTMAYVKSSHTEADYNGFLKGLSDIAGKKGIVNWDQEPKTYVAIGKGLKKAGVEGAAYEAYKKNLANSDPKKMQNIQEGYESEKAAP